LALQYMFSDRLQQRALSVFIMDHVAFNQETRRTEMLTVSLCRNSRY